MLMNGSSVQLDIQFHGSDGHGAIFQQRLVGDVYRYALHSLHLRDESHIRSSFRGSERIHRTRRVPVFPRDCWSLARGCVRVFSVIPSSDALCKC